MITISIITQISMYDIFGEIGCAVNLLSMRLHAMFLIFSGLGMAIFRIVCIENLAKQIERKNLAKIILLVEFVVIITVTITTTILGEIYSLWFGKPTTRYQICKDYGLTKADILYSYNEYDYENEEFGFSDETY